MCDHVSPPPCLPSLPALQPPSLLGVIWTGPGAWAQVFVLCCLSWAPLPARLACPRFCSFVCFCSPHHALCLSPPRVLFSPRPPQPAYYTTPGWSPTHACNACALRAGMVISAEQDPVLCLPLLLLRLLNKYTNASATNSQKSLTLDLGLTQKAHLHWHSKGTMV